MLAISLESIVACKCGFLHEVWLQRKQFTEKVGTVARLFKVSKILDAVNECFSMRNFTTFFPNCPIYRKMI